MTFSRIFRSCGGIETRDVVQIKVNMNNGIPNNPHLSALVYPQVLKAGLSSGDVAALYTKNRWVKTWVYSLFDFHHYHYAAHEVLTVISGRGVVQIGGEDGPCKEMNDGDVIILPAGYGHKLLEAEGDFTVVGAYPEGQDDIGFNRAGENTRLSSIAETPLPVCDPIFGSDGPTASLWRKNQQNTRN